MGQALMGPPCALMGRILMAALLPNGPGPNGHPWALMGQALTIPPSALILIGQA